MSELPCQLTPVLAALWREQDPQQERKPDGVNQMTPIPAYIACSLLIGQSLVTWLCLTLLGEGDPLMALTAGPDSLVLEEDRV